MDPVTFGFYAAVCAVLGLLAPVLRSPLMRLIIGAFVGIAAAALLPTLRGMTGL
ncbi:hypothetical protein VK792_15120 [Mesobacterium sp. TK19101]|uniref:Uncharacterized protein n=1 Tax=Mesobacterium hydrothermale TaxID=3111907 RepID=A0ABU6HJY0_9RHOB|nr:hypothetical protein [Mesobacterium sp. TK19101]MEC3862621.1 hypothetical protein [Mesobacterium sp. TK19101]